MIICLFSICVNENISLFALKSCMLRIILFAVRCLYGLFRLVLQSYFRAAYTKRCFCEKYKPTACLAVGFLFVLKLSGSDL